MSYKLGLVKTLVDRVFKINNSWKGFHDDINKLSIILRKNCFPVWVIDKIVNRYVSEIKSQHHKFYESGYAYEALL